LAAQVRHHSGGADFTHDDLVAVFRLSSVLLVFDGLDEIADLKRRQEVVDEILKGINRLEEIAASLQVLVTSRPAAFANSPGLPQEKFPYFQLDDLNRPLIERYANKWLRARRAEPRQAAEFRRVLKEKLDQPHLRDLARNPMQLAILLSLIHTRGSSLPDKRTALYDSYTELFFNRESEKSAVVREHRDLIVVLHSEAELGHDRGSVTADRLQSLVADYLSG
jgi:predicted NACHT family NTPase